MHERSQSNQELAGRSGRAVDSGSNLPPFSTADRAIPRFHANGPNGQILIVNDSPTKAKKLASALDGLGYEIGVARTTSEAFSSLAACRTDAVFVTQNIPEIGGAGLCQTLKNASATQFLPVFITSDHHDVDGAVAAFEAGADGYLPALWHPRVLRAQVQSSIRRKAVIDSLDDSETVLFSLAHSLEERDGSLGDHCARLALLCAVIGLEIGLPPESMVALQRGAYLHDIGKLAIPDSILFKPGGLTPEEWEIMKSHAERGERICANMRVLKPVLPIVRHHHERWDGTGYPDGLRGEEIPLLARVLQTADIYDALTSARPYKRAMTPEEAIGILKAETVAGWRDPMLTEVSCNLLPVFKEAVLLPDQSTSSLHALDRSLHSFRKTPNLLSIS